jgi:hypothetical protein
MDIGDCRRVFLNGSTAGSGVVFIVGSADV